LKKFFFFFFFLVYLLVNTGEQLRGCPLNLVLIFN